MASSVSLTPYPPSATDPSSSDGPLQVIRAGVVDYQVAWEWQQSLHAERRAGARGDTVLLLEHPSVYTAGKRTRPEHRPADGTPVIEVNRGGLITWHGPGQLVGYPIVRLPRPIDVVAYVRRMERMLISVCAELSLATEQISDRTGVWVRGNEGSAKDTTDDSTGSDRKVAAIGVRVSYGVALHGFALNCNPDLRAFDRIVPCGIDDASVTSLSAELGREVTVAKVMELVVARLAMLVDAAPRSMGGHNGGPSNTNPGPPPGV